MPTIENKHAFPGTQAHALQQSGAYRQAKAQILASIQEAAASLKGVRPPKSPDIAIEYQKMIQAFQGDRGRDLYYSYVSSGLGAGPFVELQDGSVKYDMISGIGINFFGHSHPELMAAAIDSISSDVMQGNLQPGHEARDLLQTLLAGVGKDSKLKHGWLHCSGTMANETALKVIRQKKFPATRIFAFEDCFCGRSTAMQEITDSPGYRVGQPTYGEVTYLPFYDPKIGAEASAVRVNKIVDYHVSRYPGKYAAMMIELVQGEGGFKFAPKEFYERIFAHAQNKSLAVWADEIQTFGRTGELFAYQTFGLEKYIDVVTVGKLLHACAALYSDEYNPKPGLLAGTFTGSAVALRTGTRILEMLQTGGFYGPQGKINKLSRYFEQKLEELSRKGKGWIGERRIIGGMVGFIPFDGTMDQVKALLFKLYDHGVIAFYCGHDPYLIRMLPPFGVMTEQDIDGVCTIFEKALHETALKLGKA